MKSWLVILSGLAISWHFTELTSDSRIDGVLMPLLVFIFLVALLLKVVASLGGRRTGQGYNSADTGFFGGDDSGGCD